MIQILTDKAREARNAYKRKWYKENPEKRKILEALYELALNRWDAAELVNRERQVDFHLNGNHYSITLTCHRPPKEGKG